MSRTQIMGNQIRDGAIDATKIADGSISLADLSTDVTNAIATGGSLTDNSITSSNIVDGAVAMSDLSTTVQTKIQTGWRDIISDITVRGSSNSAPTWTQMGSTPFFAYLFGLNKECWSNFHINHDYKPGGQILLHIHWTTAGTSTAPIKWRFNYAIAKGHNQASGGTFPFASSPYVTGTIDVEQACSGTAWRHMVTEIPTTINVTNAEPDSLIMLHLVRITNGGTDNTDNVFGLTLDCHYEADRQSTPQRAPNFYTM